MSVRPYEKNGISGQKREKGIVFPAWIRGWNCHVLKLTFEIKK